MKLKSLFVFGAIIALFAVGCSKDDNSDNSVIVTGISLDQDVLEVAVESTAAIVATLDPEGATGEIIWTSSDASVAAVANGIVTGISMGTTTIVASYGSFNASCEVTVVAKPIDPETLPESLKGSNYSIIQIDEISYSMIEDKVLYDLRPDNVEDSRNLYVWDNTFEAGTSSGSNFYGETEGWISLIVASSGWSGAGFTVGSEHELVDLSDMYTNPDDYVLHIGLKSAQEGNSYLFILNDGITTAKFSIGAVDYIDGDITYSPYIDFARDNEWHAVEIPLSYLHELGIYYNEPFNSVNVFAFLAGGTTGTTLDMDAVFFYKKAE